MTDVCDATCTLMIQCEPMTMPECVFECMDFFMTYCPQVSRPAAYDCGEQHLYDCAQLDAYFLCLESIGCVIT